MIALIQRVSEAQVRVAGLKVGEIGPGVLALIGIEREDDETAAGRLLERLLGFRIFPDDAGRMNRSVRETGGGLLLVPQFTLAADTRQGTRAGFSTAASPERARLLFDHLLGRAQAAHPQVESGQFGAEMQVALVNEGPVTFWLQS
jgi:D-tyrosyl-tRNA(Tyr) deacylase